MHEKNKKMHEKKEYETICLPGAGPRGGDKDSDKDIWHL